MKTNSEVSTYEQMVKAKYEEIEKKNNEIQWGTYHGYDGKTMANAVVIGNTPDWLAKIGLEKTLICDKNLFMSGSINKKDMLLLPQIIDKPISVTKMDKAPGKESYNKLSFIGIDKQNEKPVYYTAVLVVDSFYDGLLSPRNASKVIGFRKMPGKELQLTLDAANKRGRKNFVFFDKDRYKDVEECYQSRGMKKMKTEKHLIRSESILTETLPIKEMLKNKDIINAAMTEIIRFDNIRNRMGIDSNITFDIYNDAIDTLRKAMKTEGNMYFEIMQAHQIIEKTYDLIGNKEEIKRAQQKTDYLFAKAFEKNATQDLINAMSSYFVKTMNDIKTEDVTEQNYQSYIDKINNTKIRLLDALGYNIQFREIVPFNGESKEASALREKTINDTKIPMAAMKAIGENIEKIAFEKIQEIQGKIKRPAVNTVSVEIVESIERE